MLLFNHKYIKYCILVILSIGCLTVHAQQETTEQQNRVLLQQVQDSYSMGHFSEVIEQLKTRIHSFAGVSKVAAYRLLALCSIQLDEDSDADFYTQKLLDTDPYYTTTLQDPPRFVDLVNKYKISGARISTASFQDESIDEAPVPVSLITEEMIAASGARTVSELLTLYVPGMLDIGSGNVEANIASRGLYAYRQDKILVMLDGQRLNSYVSNSEALDYRTNIHKIKQIEVLRGPASSLYGNVALTATINIITKDGSELNGVNANLQAGLNNTYGASFVGGKNGAGLDFLAWGSIYNSAGEKYMENGIAYKIGGYNNNPAYDLGIKANWNDFYLRLSAQSSKLTPQYNEIQFTDGYDYDKYKPINGVKPGLTYSTFHATFGYHHKWKKMSLNVEAFGVRESSNIYNVAGDSLDNYSSQLLDYLIQGESLGLPLMTQGVCQNLSWITYALGVNCRLAWNYKLGDKSHGTLLAGFNFDRFDQLAGDYTLADHFGEVKYLTIPILDMGVETNISEFIQLKHNFSSHFILNSGVRFDHKHRYDGTTLNSLSPRFSLIYIPNKNFSLKAGWAHSFVDASYLYRASNLPYYRGNDMRPETLNSTQLGFTYNNKPSHLRYEFNVFHNMAENLVYANLGTLLQGYTFSNSVKVTTIGIENVLEYSTPKTITNLNMIWLNTPTLEGYSFDSGSLDEQAYLIGQIESIPALALNATIAHRVLNHKRWGKLWLRANAHAQSSTYMEYLEDEEFMKALEGEPYSVSILEFPFFTKVNAGVDYEVNRFRLSLSCYNLFNYRSHISGSLTNPVPQEGFNFLSTLSIRF